MTASTATPAGSTTVGDRVAFTAYDGRALAGNPATASFAITVGKPGGDPGGDGLTVVAPFVVDRTAPLLTVPTNFTLTGTSTAGGVVTYTATADDTIDGVIAPICTPVSGTPRPHGHSHGECRRLGERSAVGQLQSARYPDCGRQDNLVHGDRPSREQDHGHRELHGDGVGRCGRLVGHPRSAHPGESLFVTLTLVNRGRAAAAATTATMTFNPP